MGKFRKNAGRSVKCSNGTVNYDGDGICRR